MACSCKKKKLRLQEIQNQSNVSQFLVLCTNCSVPLEKLDGTLVPVHKVKIPVTQRDIDYWKLQGYEISVL